MDHRLLAFHLCTVALVLLSFLAGLLVEPTLQQLLLGPFNLLVPLSPFWGSLGPRFEMGAAFTVPGLFAWVGATVFQRRSGRLPGGLSLVLLLAMPLLGLGTGLIGRALFLRLVLAEALSGAPSPLQLFPITLSTTALGLGSWGLRLGVVGGMLGVAWMSLRRLGR